MPSGKCAKCTNGVSGMAEVGMEVDPSWRLQRIVRAERGDRRQSRLGNSQNAKLE